MNGSDAKSRKTASRLAVVNLLVAVGGLLVIGGLVYIQANPDADPVLFWALYGGVGAATAVLIIFQIGLARRLRAQTRGDKASSGATNED